jgi:hypothetical protein
MAIHARNTRVLLNGYDASTWANSVSTEDNDEASDCTTFSSGGYKEYVDGFTEGSLSIGGVVELGAGLGLEQLAAMRGNAGTNSLATVLPQGITHGLQALVFSGPNTAGNTGFQVADVATMDVEIKPSGGYGLGKTLQAWTELTADGNGTELDNTVATTNGALFALHVVATEGVDPSTAITIEHSVDGVTWVQIAAFAAVTEGNVYELKAVSGTINRRLRVVRNLGADTDSIELHVAVVRL